MVMSDPAKLNEPSAGLSVPMISKVCESPSKLRSTSLTVNRMVVLVSSGIAAVFSCTTGLSFTGRTVMVIVAVLDVAALESVARYVRVVVPFQSFTGVKVSLLPEMLAVPCALFGAVTMLQVWLSPSN
jgi:hypothetical protein